MSNLIGSYLGSLYDKEPEEETKEPVQPIEKEDVSSPEPVKKEQQVEKIEEAQEVKEAEIISTKKKEELEREVFIENKINKNSNHPARHVMRHDLNESVYAIKPPKSSFGLYNTEVEEFMSMFSKRNQQQGGTAITKSQLIEIVFDVMLYDAKLEPLGFESHEQLRRYLQGKLK